MSKKNMKRMLCGVFALLLLISVIPQTAKAKEWDVTRGTENYNVIMDGATDVFIGNTKTIGRKVGTEYYLTYTVKEDFKVEQYRQNGIVGTNSPANGYPYLDGIYYYNVTNRMLRPGYTYFLKFKITEEGFDYRISCAKDDDSQYISFKMEAGEVKANLGYFGVFLGDAGMTGNLIKVRCYDKEGNDLGVRVTTGSTNPETGSKCAWAQAEKKVELSDKVKHSYNLVISDAFNLAISNKKKSESNIVYMEYTVKSSDSKVWQAGVINSTTPTIMFPYTNGQMLFQQGVYDPKQCGNEPLLIEGAKYLYTFEKFDTSWAITVERTLNKETVRFSFPLTHGTYNPKAEYFSIWFADGYDFLVNAVLEDFKCYDANGNNLGVQTNSEYVSIKHFGEIEDYAGCEAVYYCEVDSSIYALYKDQALKYTENGTTLNGKYNLKDQILTTEVDGENQQYDYFYQYFTSKEDERVYDRLHEYKVTFVTGNDTEIESQILNAENGYVVQRPENPSLKGNQFEGWYTSDGTEYLFDNLQVESITLYAKWAEVEYVDGHDDRTYQPYIAVGVSALIFTGALIAGIFVLRRKNNNGNSK